MTIQITKPGKRLCVQGVVSWHGVGSEDFPGGARPHSGGVAGAGVWNPLPCHHGNRFPGAAKRKFALDIHIHFTQFKENVFW